MVAKVTNLSAAKLLRPNNISNKTSKTGDRFSKAGNTEMFRNRVGKTLAIKLQSSHRLSIKINFGDQIPLFSVLMRRTAVNKEMEHREDTCIPLTEL
jgi:hypothetical protein